MPDLCACAHVCVVRARVHACVRVSVLTPPLHTWRPPVLGRLPRPHLRPPRAPGTVGWTIRLLCLAELGSALDQGSQSSHTRSSMWAGDTHHAHGHGPHMLPGPSPGEGGPAQRHGWGRPAGPGAGMGPGGRCFCPSPVWASTPGVSRLVPRPPWRAGGHLPCLHGAVPLLATRPVVWGQGSRVDLGTLAPHTCGAQTWLHTGTCSRGCSPHRWPLPAPPAEDSSPGAGTPPAAVAEGALTQGLSPDCASARRVL